MISLEELDQQLAKEEPKKTSEPTVIIHKKGYSESHSEWLARRVEEDNKLKDMKCPKCGHDCKLVVTKNAVSIYNCTAEENHQFTRFSGLLTSPYLTKQYADRDNARYWES